MGAIFRNIFFYYQAIEIPANIVNRISFGMFLAMHRLIVPGILLILFSLIIHPFFLGQVYGEFDLREQFFPWRMFYSLSLEQGDLGLWNPFLARGYYHHGEGQSGLLHPLHLILYGWLPIRYAIFSELCFYYPISWLGMYWMLRKSIRLPAQMAVVGGGLFCFSTFFYAHFPHVNLLWVYSHLPFLIYFLERSLIGKRPYRHASCFALGIASMLLLGHPQMVWINGLTIIGALAGIVVMKRSGISGLRQRIMLLILGGIAGVLVGCMQLLPTIEYFLHSSRKNISLMETHNFSLHPLNILGNVSPFFFMDKSVGDYIYSSSGRTFLNSLQEFPAYLGIVNITVLYVGYILLRKKQVFCRREVLLVIGIMASLLLALGKYGGLIHVFRFLPFVSKFRCPVRYTAITLFLLAILVSLCLQGIYRYRGRISQLSLSQTLILFVPTLISSLVVGYGIYFGPIAFPGGITLHIDKTPYLLLGPVMSFSVVALIVLYMRGKSDIAFPLISVLCLLDISLYGMPILRESPLSSWDKLEAGMVMMRQRDHSFRHVSSLNEPAWYGVYLASGYLGIPPQESLDLFSNRKHLQLASIRYAHGTTRTFLLEDAFPRVRIVSNLLHATDSLNNISTIDLTNTALTDAPLELSGKPLELSGKPLFPREKAVLLEDGFSYLRIAIQVQEPRLLVVSDRWSSNWKATVDGRDRDIIPLFNHMIRGMLIYPEDRLVQMNFHSTSLYWGYALAIVGIGIIGILFLKSNINF